MNRLDVEAVSDGTTAGRTLPSSWYTDPQVFELERRLIFRRAWEYVGGSALVSKPGDYFTCEVAGTPVVVVRDRDQTLRAFLNICRHRHHPVVQGCGNKPAFTCFYHQWTYGLDGALIRAPRSDESPSFEACRLGLQPVGVDTWGDMAFVNLSGSATPLHEALGVARERAAERGLPIESAKFRGRRSMSVEANWKLVWDNNCECYHCPTVHARWYRQARLDPKHYFDRRIGPYHYETELQLIADQPSQFAYYVWPAVYFQSSDINYALGASSGPNSMLVLRFVALGVKSTRVDADIYHVDDIDAAEVERRLDQTFSVIEEDKSVCESMQRAHDSGAAEPGTLLKGIDTEDHTLLWQQLIHRAITTPDVPLYAAPNESRKSMSALAELMSRLPDAPFEVELNARQVEEFRSRGFLQIPRITSDEELVWLREVYDALFAEKRGSYRGGYFDLTRRYDSQGEDLLPQIIAPEARFPQLKETSFWKNGASLARQLIEVDDVRGWGHMIRKPARIGESLPWHQDEAYWDPNYDYRALGCWMPLDNATKESGCMSMIPGSHLGDIVGHRHLNDDPTIEGLETITPPARAAEAVLLPTPAGGAVLHHCRMLHMSGPNVSDHVRRAYANEWQTTPVKRAVPYVRPWQVEGREAHAKHFGTDLEQFD